MINSIETLAGLIAAITTIILFIKKPWQWFKHKMEEERQFKRNVMEALDSLKEELQEVKKDTRENKMYILKDTIMNDKLSLGERIKAGDVYVKNDGNGFVKGVYHKLIEKAESEYES